MNKVFFIAFVILLCSCENSPPQIEKEQNEKNKVDLGINWEYNLATRNIVPLDKKKANSIRLIKYGNFQDKHVYYTIDQYYQKAVIEKKIVYEKWESDTAFTSIGYHFKPIVEWDDKIDNVINNLQSIDCKPPPNAREPYYLIRINQKDSLYTFFMAEQSDCFFQYLELMKLIPDRLK